MKTAFDHHPRDPGPSSTARPRCPPNSGAHLAVNRLVSRPDSYASSHRHPDVTPRTTLARDLASHAASSRSRPGERSGPNNSANGSSSHLPREIAMAARRSGEAVDASRKEACSMPRITRRQALAMGGSAATLMLSGAGGGHPRPGEDKHRHMSMNIRTSPPRGRDPRRGVRGPRVPAGPSGIRAEFPGAGRTGRGVRDLSSRGQGRRSVGWIPLLPTRSSRGRRARSPWSSRPRRGWRPPR